MELRATTLTQIVSIRQLDSKRTWFILAKLSKVYLMVLTTLFLTQSIRVNLLLFLSQTCRPHASSQQFQPNSIVDLILHLERLIYYILFTTLSKRDSSMELLTLLPQIRFGTTSMISGKEFKTIILWLAKMSDTS